jgi:VWFA-related protein
MIPLLLASAVALQEHVEVTLVEVVVRATARDGAPVATLAPADVRVSEGGLAREVAFVEPFLSAGRDAAPAATLYDAAGAPSAPTPSAVAPPVPARRFVLAFDVANSRARARAAWREAAAAWLRDDARPGDRVAIVLLGTGPEWVRSFTADPAAALDALSAVDLAARGGDRDRRRETSVLWNEIESCASSAESGGRRVGADGTDCAAAILEPAVAQWNAESRETLRALRSLVGQLGAIPGRKELLLFSDGWYADPPAQAASLHLALFGAGTRVPTSGIGRNIGIDVALETRRLHEAAAAAGVAVFAFDTRSPAERGHHDTVESDRAPASNALGAQPWADAYAATSGALEALANETGGDAYFGAKDVAGKLARARAAWDGLHVVGFYRPQGADPDARLRIGSARKGLRLDHARRGHAPADTPRAANLELSIRAPESGSAAGRRRLPVVVDLAVRDLPLRNVDGTWGCRVAYFVQAFRPDGTIVAEAFDDATIAFDDRPDAHDPRTYRQRVTLDLPLGPARIRVRAADDDRRVLADRAVDVTLSERGVRPGL